MRDAMKVCVSCGHAAGPHNTWYDPEEQYSLNRFDRFAVCDACLPADISAAFGDTTEVEPEEAAFRCWYSAHTKGDIPFDEVGELVRGFADRAVAARDAEWRALVAPFAEFWRQWQRAPISKIDDEFYGIHVGTQFEASLRRSDFKRVSDFLDAMEAP